MRKVLGWILFAIGSWMLISPQALLGLKQLKWMYDYAFPGEVLIGVVVMCAAYYLLDVKIDLEKASKAGH
ncbi:MAG: hypothetical protein ACOY30_11135 [Bacillota bacterium]